MRQDDLSRDAQAQTLFAWTVCIRAVLEAYPPFEDDLQAFARNPGPMVSNAEVRTPPLAPDVGADLAARRICDRIAEQVSEDLGHPLSITRYRQTLRCLQHKAVPLRSSGRDFNLLTRHVDQIAVAELQREASG